MRDGIYTPTDIVPKKDGGSLIHEGDDNTDLTVNTIDGKNSFHSMARVIFQKHNPKETQVGETHESQQEEECITNGANNEMGERDDESQHDETFTCDEIRNALDEMDELQIEASEIEETRATIDRMNELQHEEPGTSDGSVDTIDETNEQHETYNTEPQNGQTRIRVTRHQKESLPITNENMACTKVLPFQGPHVRPEPPHYENAVQ